MDLTDEQEEILRAVREDSEHLWVNARAGAGKTFTTVKAAHEVEPHLDARFVAFNRAVADELGAKLPSYCPSSTLHSMGFGAVRDHFGNWRGDVEKNRNYNVLKQLVSRKERKQGLYLGQVNKLVSLAKNTLAEDEQQMWELIDEYQLDLVGWEDRAIHLVETLMERAVEEAAHVIDFDDMVWLPAKLDLNVDNFDLLFVDEAQDMNRAQQEMILRAIDSENGRIVIVGDPKQSIYHFRGADSRAIERMVDVLDNTWRGVKEMPLTMTFRCPREVVSCANEIVPDLRAAPWADDGRVDVTRHDDIYTGEDEARPGDAILCRTNAPLVSCAYRLIQNEKPAIIQGRNVAKGLVDLVDRVGGVDLDTMLENLRDWQLKETKRLRRQNRESRVQSIKDQVNCIEILGTKVDTVAELKRTIQDLFDDVDEEDGRILLSTVHRMKGREAKRVWILKPEQHPHPMAHGPEQLEEEENIAYVAATRAEEELLFRGGVPLYFQEWYRRKQNAREPTPEEEHQMEEAKAEQYDEEMEEQARRDEEAEQKEHEADVPYEEGYE